MSTLQERLDQAIANLHNKPLKGPKGRGVTVQSEATINRQNNLKIAREAKKQALEEKRANMLKIKEGPSKKELFTKIQEQETILTKLQEMETQRLKNKEEKKKIKEQVPAPTPEVVPVQKPVIAPTDAQLMKKQMLSKLIRT